MQLWQSGTWNAEVVRRGEHRKLELSVPFALIGSHPACKIQIAERNVPPVAYLAVRYGDTIELWPTCPLAFSVWGKISPNTEVLLGRCRMRLFVPSPTEEEIDSGDDNSPHLSEEPQWDEQGSGNVDVQPRSPGAVEESADDSVDIKQLDSFMSSPDASEASDSSNPLPNQTPSTPDPGERSRRRRADKWHPRADLIFDWGDGEKRKVLSRSVSILGEDHPSLIRLHGTALQRCDRGVICFGSRVWVIELHPERLQPGEKIIKELHFPDPSMVLAGGLHVWSADKDKSKTLQRDKSPVPRDLRSEMPEQPLAEPVATIGPQSDAGEDVARSHVSQNLPAAEETPQDSPQRNQLDEITDAWTDRLLMKTEEKSERKRLLVRIALGLIVLLALLVIAATVIWGVLPLIRSIYGG